MLRSQCFYGAVTVGNGARGGDNACVMNEAVQLFQVVACAVGLAACGYPPLPELKGDISDAPSSDAVPAPQFLSCAALPAMCGTNGNDNCCNSPEVPGGTYHRSYDLATDGSFGNMSYPATVSRFRLDKYEVTVGRFRAFVNAGMGTQAHPPLPGAGARANISGSGWDATWNTSLATDQATLVNEATVKCDPSMTYPTWTNAVGANDARPMNCLTWYEAMAVCAWDGGYLPTEAEWNYAATGGDQQRAYPWSNPAGSLTPLDSAHASYYTSDCTGDGVPGCTVADLVVVGSKPAGNGRWGQSDLAGNVWELTLDWFGNYGASCTDCANTISGSKRVVRGGSYDFSDSGMRTGFRDSRIPQTRNTNVGVRCARAP